MSTIEKIISHDRIIQKLGAVPALIVPLSTTPEIEHNLDVSGGRVAGAPDPSQVERVLAFVVLKRPALAGGETERLLIELCRDQLIKWFRPRQVKFLRELPKMHIGKINHNVLVQQHVSAHETRDKG